jgi:hypothetical protein
MRSRPTPPAAVRAVREWHNGSPVQNAVLALDILETDLKLLPVSSKNQGFIVLAIDTVQEILALVPAPAPQPGNVLLKQAVFTTYIVKPHQFWQGLRKVRRSSRKPGTISRRISVLRSW